MNSELLSKTVETAVTQVPNLVVLGWIVWMFLGSIKIINARHSDLFRKQSVLIEDFQQLLLEVKNMLQTHIRDSKK